MESANFLEKLSAQFGQSATVKNVYGEPIQAGEKTILPVAQIAYGLGGGYGQGRNLKPKNPAELPMAEGRSGEGAGGGGGLYAKPKGVYEISTTGTRFIPAHDHTQLLLGLLIGFVLRGWLHARRTQKAI